MNNGSITAVGGNGGAGGGNQSGGGGGSAGVKGFVAVYSPNAVSGVTKPVAIALTFSP